MSTAPKYTDETYPAGFRIRDAKAIRRFVHSTAAYKSSRYMSYKGEAYDAGSRLAHYFGKTRPMTVGALADLAALVGVHVDTERRLRKMRERAAVRMFT